MLFRSVAIAIAGYLTLGENPRAVALLRWLYRWPLFIPFVVTGQVMRTFLAKNGMLNHVLIGTGLIEPISAQSMLDWRGIVIAFVWKQAPFVTLLLAGAMASLERQHIEAYFTRDRGHDWRGEETGRERTGPDHELLLLCGGQLVG